MEGNVLADGASSQSTAAIAQTQSQLDAQRAFERDLEIRIQSMLENVLGPEKAIVRVSADMDWDQITTQQETYVPAEEGSVLRSSHEVNEYYAGSDQTFTGVPGTDTNIPDAAPSYQTEIGETDEGSGYQRTDTTVNYEVSRSVSQIVSATGELKRLSVSVMVNDVADPAQLDAIRQATIAAAGIDETRGDLLTVQSMAFDRSYYDEEAAAMEEIRQQEFYLRLAKWGAIALVLIVLLIVARVMQRNLTRRPTGVIVEEELDTRTALLQEVSRAVDVHDASQHGENSALPEIGPPAFDKDQQVAAEKAQMLRQLQLMSKNRPGTLAQIIQFWLAEEDA
jgi:flagellar M-ring protein FliF